MGEQRLIGVTQHFQVSLDSDLGDLFGQVVLDNCENDFAVIQEYFGGIQPLLLPIEVYIVDQEGASWNPRLGPKAMTCGTRGRDQMEVPWPPSWEEKPQAPRLPPVQL